MMCTAVTACSGNADPSGSGTAENHKNSKANLKEAAPSQTKLSPDEPAWKLDTTPITFDWYINFDWYTSKWGGNVVSEYITKKTGVSLNFIVPAGDASEKLNTMMAARSLPDFITLGSYEDSVQKMINGDMVLPLNELADQYDPYFFKAADPVKLSWYTQANGNVYGYPNASSSPADYRKYGQLFTSNQTFVVRKDMYEALGKPDMSTPEGFLGALKAAKEKFPEVDGQPLIPIGLHEFTETGNYSLEAYLQNFLAIPQQKDGKLYDRRSDPTYLKWLKVFRQANEDGLIPTDVYIDEKRLEKDEKISQGRYFAMLYQWSDFLEINQALYRKDPNKVYIAIDGPANDAHDAPTLAGNGVSGWTVTLISKNVKDKKRAIAFLSYLLSEEGNKDLFLGEKGVTYDTIDGKDQFLPEVMHLLNTDRQAFNRKYGASYMYWMLMDKNMNLAWMTGMDAEPAKQIADWTRGKTIGMSEFENLGPDPTTKEGIAQGENTRLWAETLPKLLMAGSDAEFDRLFAAFMKTITEDPEYEAINASRQAAYERNVQKLKSSLNP
ncbi:extracellular solute-binding protein [Paenibacillus mucilaginosus]|uniref:Extracellular solute-binding protein family 1 n=1 Tax=Paenibacillus mucilaginosus (strain KNP414) TaxID=1036673 RepID=F8FQN5_PAEMK|nr:extracellular solute-binding protein [Paenibacillus mucilaginosus]AEI40390.1 extracellular solute-binding protein family 1 [Paenibacillus mucilaginosus KNP414]MCG7213259.1 extracellular solute-binding protein [Paenibacillus mucilaginosus]WDM29579.1 extracellular solute-binding protein [Paenibacillus mucilaginosus]